MPGRLRPGSDPLAGTDRRVQGGLGRVFTSGSYEGFLSLLCDLFSFQLLIVL